MTLTQVQRNSAKKWLELLEQDQLKEEKSNYFKFADIILNKILGYSLDENEHKHVEFQYSTPDGKGVCFEVKGTDTENLFAIQYRPKKEQETPIKQTWDYMGKLGLEYGVCTNYKHFILITKRFGYSRYHFFDFSTIKHNEEKLKEFVKIFSKTRLLDDDTSEILLKESQDEEKTLQKEFYSLFHQTRVFLIKSFDQIVDSRADAIQYTQIFLNRLIFIFFAEDRGFCEKVFRDKALHNLQGGFVTRRSNIVCRWIIDLFGLFKNGSEETSPRIPEFNGGLFNKEIPSNVYFKDLYNPNAFQDTKYNVEHEPKVASIVKKYPYLNPIIQNLLKISSYDFNTDISVNILGHIFEQSITDIERLQQSDKLDYSQRKDEGIYYTPEYVTDYICRHTIIPYLSKSGTAVNSHDLVHEYIEDDLSTLEAKLKEIKILDPACGSGAFLVKAVNVLIEIHQIVNNYKFEKLESGQKRFDEWTAEAEALRVVKNNIYGVDINEQSVEITKLSLFLTLNSAETKLPDLSHNIKVGNSLICNEFDWKTNFEKIFDGGGFDIIIGNPPYVRQEKLAQKVDMQVPDPADLELLEFKIPGRTDLSGYFYYHALTWLKDDGYLGFITSDSWMHFNYGKELKKVLLRLCNIKTLVRTAFNIFEDANVKTVTAILQKTKDDDKAVNFVYVGNDMEFGDRYGIIREQDKLGTGNWIPYLTHVHLTPKIKMTKMNSVCEIKSGRKTGANEFFVLTKEIIKEYKIGEKFMCPVISNDIKGYYLKDSDTSEYLLYVKESKGELQKSSEGRNVLRYIIEKGETPINSDKSDLLCDRRSMKANKRWWYCLKLDEIPPIFLAKLAHERMRFYENNGSFRARDNFMYLTPKDMELRHVFLAYMSSTYFALHLELNGHEAGGGALSFLVTDYKDAPVPDFKVMSDNDINRLKNAWAQLKQDLDIKKLDDVVFDVLGFNKDEQNAIVKEFEKWNKDRLNR